MELRQYTKVLVWEVSFIWRLARARSESEA